MTENPYQPPVTVDCSDERLVFRGEIDFKDYFELLTVSGVERFGWSVFENPVLTILLSVVLGSTVYEVIGTEDYGLAITATMVVLFIVGFAWLQKKFSRRSIARQQLQIHRDLLGTAEGELTADGMLFFDGVHHYWFGPSLLRSCVVSRRGVRYQVDRNAYRFLALSSRLFHPYELATAKRLRDNWSRSVAAGRVPSQMLWNRIGQAPADAVSIQFGNVPNEAEIAHVSPWISLWELVGYFAMLGSILFILKFRGWYSSRLLGMVGLWALWGTIWAILSRTLSAKTAVATLEQFGWITSTEFATYNIHSGVRLTINKLQLKLDTEDRITGTIHSQPFAIERAMLVNAGDWERLCAIVEQANHNPPR